MLTQMPGAATDFGCDRHEASEREGGNEKGYELNDGHGNILSEGEAMPKLKTSGKIHNTITGFDFREDAPLSPRRAMRQMCLSCCAGVAAEVKICAIPDCPLWPFRMGRGICTDPAGTVIQMPERSAAQIEAGQRAGKRLAEARQN